MPRAKKISEQSTGRKPRSKKSALTALPTLTDTLTIPLPEKKLPKKKPARKKMAKKSSTKKISAPLVMDSVPLSLKPLSISTPTPQKNAKTCMSSAQCFLYGGLICIVGTVALALFLSIVVLAPLGTRIEQSRSQAQVSATDSQDQALNDLEKTITQPADADTKESNGFYGTLLSKDKGVLMVKELAPSLPLEEKANAPTGTKTFVVRVSDKTGYTYQHPRDEKDASAPLFAPEEGTLDNMKTGMYIFVATSDDTKKTETLNATHILYSEKSPFAE